ncbi:MAG: hypothetical protein HW412_1285, partial [Bacteroidetes bacterium]|nr:hypothetical protein [Bacteroidota bacterium]
MRVRAFILSSLLLCLGADWAYAQTFWQPTGGPNGGRVRALAFNTAGDAFAGTINTGVFRQLSGAPSWTPVNNGVDTVVYSLAITPTGALLAGTVRGIFRSVNNGASWIPTNLTTDLVFCLAVKSSNEMYAGAVNGNFSIARSTNDGVTWSPVPLPGLSIGSLAINPVNGYVFAGTLTEGVYRSTDNGISWFRMSNGLNDLVIPSMAASPNGTVFAGTQNNGLYLSMDNGGNWIPAGSGVPSPTIAALAVNASGHIFAGIINGIFRSTNNGNSWNPVNTGLTDFQIQCIGFDAKGFGYTGTIGGLVSRTTSSTVPPAPPLLLSPPNGSTDLPINLPLIWNQSVGAGTYRLQLSTDAAFGSIVLDDSTLTDTTRGVGPLVTSTTYYWRVSARNLGGASAYSVPHSFTTVPPPPPAPLLVSPPDGAIDQPTTLTFSWNAATGATLYRLQVSSNPGFSAIVFDDSTIAGTSRQVSSLLNNATYFWRVRGRNTGGAGPYSPPRSFTTIVAPPPPPTLVLPADGATNQPTILTMSWNASPGATTYRLQLSTNPAFTAIVFDDSTIAGTSRQVGSLLNNTTYYWRVNARNAGGTSPYSTPRSFTTIVARPPAPTLVSPPDGSINQPTTLTMSWNVATGATSYRLQVSTDVGFTAIVFDDSSITGTSRQVSSFLNNTTHYWRVNARNAGGTSPFSTTWSFTTSVAPPLPPPTPTLVSPPDGATNLPTTLTMNWNASTGATTYRLQVSTNATFTAIVFDDSTIAGTSRQVSSLLNNTTHYWRVNARNAGGTSSYSTTWSFTTVVGPPPAPLLVSPADGATNQPTILTMSWNASTGATSYRLQLSTNAAFTAIVFDDSTIAGTSRQVSSLLNNTTYFWRVRAENAGGQSPYSLVRSFTTIVSPPSSPTLLSPPDGATNQPATLILSWNASTGATSYRLQVSTNAAFTAIVLEDSTIVGASRQVGPLLNNTIYFWRVNAKNAGGTSSYSATWSFRTVGVPGFSVSRDSIFFGDVAVNSSRQDSVIVTNTGTSPLTVSGVTSSNVRFAVAPTSATIGASLARTFVITFTPNAQGPFIGNIIFT